MKHAISRRLGLSLALLAFPATAQLQGRINDGAPVVESSITFANQAKLAVRYTAIHFGEGQWQGLLEDTGRHERFNAAAQQRPIGSVSTTADVVASGREVPAGEYDMFFTVSERGGWILNLKRKGEEAEPIRWRMVLQDSAEESKRLRFNLNAADDKAAASLTIAFGKQQVAVSLAMKKADQAEKPPEKVEKKAGNG